MSVNITLQHACNVTDIPSSAQFQAWADSANQNTTTEPALCIRLVGKDESAYLNLTFRQQDKSTNILSFHYELPDPIHAVEPMLGDIILCPEVIIAEALEHGVDVMDHYAHLVIHGMLHLQGYDHHSDTDSLIMQAKEIELLARFNISNPYE